MYKPLVNLNGHSPIPPHSKQDTCSKLENFPSTSSEYELRTFHKPSQKFIKLINQSIENVLDDQDCQDFDGKDSIEKTSYSDKTTSLHTLSTREIDKFKLFKEFKGIVKIEIYGNVGLFTVHVIRAKSLQTCHKICNSFVECKLIDVIDEKNLKPDQNEEIKLNNTNPIYHQKNTFEFTKNDYNKRICINIWNRPGGNCCHELIGTTSFGVYGLLKKSKNVSGWYCLLPCSVGIKKHLKYKKNKSLNLDVPNVSSHLMKTMESFYVELVSNSVGFGVVVSGENPVYICRIEQGSPAEIAGVCINDVLVRFNGVNISRSSSYSVAKLFRTCSKASIHLLRKQHTLIKDRDYYKDKDYILKRNENFHLSKKRYVI
ncbi:hypothetical protein A3Q56_04348 [Intoshia linei]|uniref:Uncharacterized protein n=1 Tax=Intoshia linei TaxID=1819745 RepID=A0A177B0X2_9BILA|nr:hypothetical protein A3Q56_04348 [Intoshia linei]